MRYGSYYRYNLTPIWIILGINVVLFIISVLYSQFLWYFGLHPSLVLQHPWTVITSMFLHADMWHIFTNMLALYFLGSYLLMLIGTFKFLLIYFCGGILGSIFFLVLPHPISWVVGASGAIFALGGALAVLRPKLKVIVFPLPVPVPLWGAIVFGFLIISFFPNVAWQAHLGGLVVGGVAGYFLRKKQKPIIFLR